MSAQVLATTKQINFILRLCKRHSINVPPSLINKTMTIQEAATWIINNLHDKEVYK